MPEKKPPQNDKAHKRPLKEDDHHLWTLVTRDVRRMHPPESVKNLPPIPKSIHTSPSIQGNITLETLKPVTLPPFSPAESSLQIDGTLKKKMTRGDLELDGKIDLHGLTLDQAHDQFMAFIKRHIHQRSRFLLVITGKGRSGHSDHRGVIRKSLPDWCNNPSLKPHILHTSPAHIRHGGTGATYILLRRHRSSRS